MKKKIYCIPGLGANSAIFDYLQLDKDKYELIKIDWIEPVQGEDLQEYITRLISPIHFEKPILIGVSFGGMIAQEISNRISCEKVFLISSVKSEKEFPSALRYIYYWNLYKIFPSNYIKKIMNWADKYIFIKAAKKKIDVYKKYMVKLSPYYFDWSIKQALEWKKKECSTNIVHIHGTQDHIFPAKNIRENVQFIKGGTHAMILTHAKEISKMIEKESL